MAIIFPSTRLNMKDIDITEFKDLVQPKLFFELLGIRKPLLNTYQPEFKISYTHKIIVEKIENEGILVGSESKIVAGFIDLGIVVLCLKNDICEKMISDVIEGCKGLSIERNQKKLVSTIEGLNLSDKRICDNLKECASKCSDDIRKYMEMVLGEKIYKLEDASVHISSNLIQAFTRITSGNLDDRMYQVGRGGKRVSPTIPKVLFNANRTYRNALRKDKTATECLRGAFVIGMRIFSQWVLNEELPYHEYYFSKLLYTIGKHKNYQEAAKFSKRKKQWW